MFAGVYERGKNMKKRARRGMALYLIVVCCCIIGLLAGISQFRQKGEKSKSEMEQKLEVQKEALEQLKEDEGEYNEKNIILSDTTKAEAEGLAESIGAKVRVTKNGKVAVLYLDGDKDIKQVYKNKKYLNYIGKMNPDYYGTLSSTSGIKGRSLTSLADSINLKDTWNKTKGSGTKIAVIDTGIDTDNKYLASKISEKSFDATTGKVVSDYDISVVEERDQMTSHGTSVASAIAADWNENTGIGGIAPDTELVVINVMSSGEILSSDVIFGISYAIECDVDVINMSFSFEGEKNPFEKYTQLAVDSDIICVAAAGNYSTSTPVWPAADENVIGVGAVNQGEKDEAGKMQVSTTIGGSSSEEEQKEFTLSEKSDYGDNVDIVAPDNLKVVNAKGEETILGGTSASSATVAGAVALYLSQNTHEEFSKVKETLYAAGKDMGTPGIDWYYGCGMLDVDALVVEEKGTITYDYLTEELSSEKHIFVRGHILQDVPEPERNYAVFDGWYHDINCTEEWDNLEEVLHEDVTMYAAWANEDDTDAFSYTILEDETAEIKSYRGKRRYLTIPNRIDGYTVSSIGTRAFVGNSRLRRVELPDTLKTIKEYAFSSCTRLLQIEIPSSVVEIQHHAFSECAKLGAVSIPENGKLTTIGDYAFQECGSLPRIDLPATLQSINATAFFKDNSLKKITISEKNTKYDADGEALYQKQDKRTLVCYVPGKSGQYVVDDSTESIGKYAFAYSRLSGVTLPDSLTKLENYSFVSSRIEKITIPEAIEAIPEGCFNECNNLQTVSLGKNLTSIGEYSFTNCQNLEEVQVPEENNIQSIGMNAFYACVKLNNIDFIKSKVSTIDSGAFAACYSVKEVTLPKTLKVLGDRTFVSCYNLETVIFEDGIGLDKLREWTFNGCEALKNIILPEGLQEIGEDCFLVSGLEFIHIPSTVTNIGYGAFGHCLSMKKIEVDNASKNYKTIDNVLFELNDNGEPAILHTYPAGLEGEYKVPDEVTEIAESAFYAANKLTNITFGQNLQKIGRYAFRYIASLTSLEFNVNLQEIGEYAFEQCASLTDVKLNENLVTLKTGAFSFCWKLKNINIPDKLQTIEPYCFTYCEDLESIHIAKGVISIGMKAFSGDTNLKKITFAEDGALSRLNNEAFAYCGITAMTIPASIQSMGEEVFKNCTKLESVTFEENSKLNALTAWVFAGADNLKSITFKENAQLTMIQARALERMNSLQTVDVSKCTKLTTIDNYAFYGCASMESFAIPENVTEIGRYAFYGCKKFTRLDIPEKMDTIGRYAFAGIPDIKIYFNSAVLPAHLQEYWDYGIRGYYLGTGETHSNADWKYTVLNDGTAVLIEYIGTNTEVNVTTVDGYTVSAVGANVLKEDSTVQSLTLPESVKSICNYAFENTKNLRSISIPASVEMIGTYAFYKSGVEQVNFASDSKLTYIDAYAFSETENLKNISIPEKVTEVRKYAFASSALNQVSFAQNAELNLIGRYAFSNSKLQEVQLPNHALKVDYHAFDGITSLNTLKFGTGNTQLYGYAFYNTGLTEVNLPENIEYVGEYCFSFCKELTAINVEEANTQYSSEKGVFFNKKQTKLIQCPAGKSGTYNIPDKTEALGFGAFEGSILSKIGISNSSKLNTIGYKAFYDCEQITSMYIPATLVSVDYYAFAYCKKLSDFTLGEGSALKGIYEGAFYGCEALQSIEIPDGVAEIGEYAFYGCEALNFVDIKETSNLQGIYAHAFDYTGLTEFTIPNTVNEVGQYAFAHGKYTQFTTGTGLKEIEEGILFGNDKVSEITLKHLNDCDYATLKYLFGNENSSEKAIPQSLKSVTVANATIIPEGYFRNYEYIEKVTLNDVQTIGAEAFAKCKDLKTVTGSESLTSIEEKAFYDCAELTSIENLEQVKEYKDSVFENCQKLNVQENIFTNAVSIGNSAFKECDALQKAVFSEKLQKIGNDSFRGCDELQELTIPDTNKAEGVTLGTNSFASCGKLSKVTLGEGITAIGEAAFCDLPSLYDVKLPSTLKVIEERTFEGAALKYAEISEGTEEIQEKAFDQDTINAAWNDNENNIIVWLPRSIKTVAVDAFTNDVMYYVASSIPKNFNLDDKSKIYFNCNNVRENDSLHLCDLGDKTILMYYSGQEKNLDLSRFENIQINKIGDAAFCQNEMIKEINLGENCSEIGKKAFWLCKSLENILGAENIVKIGAEAFYWCGELQNINLTDNLKEINAAAFEECYNLKSIGSPTQIAKLESGVFWGCGNLKGVLDFRNTEITDTTTLLGRTGNGNLEILLPDNLEKIGERMFWSSYIPNIEFPDSIKSIGEKAFQYANLQEKLELPSMVEEIGPYAFDHSTVKKLIIPKSAKNIDTTAFAVKDYWETDGTKQNLFVYFEADELPDTLKEGWDDAIKGYALGYQGEKYSNGFSYRLLKDGAEIYGYDGKDKNISLDTIDGYPVVSVAERTFYENGNIENVYISRNVENIDLEAFEGCRSLKKVDIEKGSPIKAIPYLCFSGCDLSEGITLPEGLEEIATSAFNGCGFSEIDLPEDNCNLQDGVFSGCRNLKEITIPKNNKEIRRYLFYGCESLQSVIMLEKVTKIEEGAFGECEKLEKINVPDYLDELGRDAFKNCKKLLVEQGGLYYIKNYLVGYEETEKKLDYVVREGTTQLATEIFKDCTSAKSITLPEGTIKAIPEYAFTSTNLTSLTIPNSVEKIGYLAFANMTKLDTLSIPTMSREYNDTSFNLTWFFGIGGVNGWKTPETLKNIIITGSSESVQCELGDYVESLVFTGSPENIEILGNNIKELNLPERIKSIDISISNMECSDTLTLSDGLEEVKGIHISNLKTLELPLSVKTIDNRAFMGSDCLEHITMPIANAKFSDYFDWDDMSHSAVISKTLKTIEVVGEPTILPEGYFSYCKYVEKIVLPDTIQIFKSGAVSGCERLTQLNIPKSLKQIEQGAMGGGVFTKISLPEGVEKIADGAFAGNSELIEVNIPSTTKELDGGAFRESAVTNLTIKSKNITIEGSFTSMNRLQSIVLPFVGYSSENDCTLKELFKDCDLNSLKQVVLLDSCKTIRENAFEGITGIDIYCYTDADAASWPSGWNNGNRVHYMDQWNYVDFCVDGSTVYSSLQGIGDALKLPPKSLRTKEDDKQYSYTFVGWDVNGDGIADNIFASNLRNFVTANAVYSVVEKDNMSKVTANKLEEQKDGSLNIDATSKQTNIQKAVANISGEKVASIAGKETNIKTDVGTVSFDAAATNIIGQKVKEESLNVSLENVDNSLVTGLSKEDALYNIDMISGDTDVTFSENLGEETTGYATITIPYTLEDGEKPIVSYINEY